MALQSPIKVNLVAITPESPLRNAVKELKKASGRRPPCRGKVIRARGA